MPAKQGQWIPDNASLKEIANACREVLETFGWHVFVNNGPEAEWFPFVALKPDVFVALKPDVWLLHAILVGVEGSSPERKLRSLLGSDRQPLGGFGSTTWMICVTPSDFAYFVGTVAANSIRDHNDDKFKTQVQVAVARYKIRERRLAKRRR